MRGGRRLTPRGWAVTAGSVVLLVVAYAVGFRELLYPACLGLLVVAAAIVWSSRAKPRLQVVRRFEPGMGVAGAPVHVRLDVRNGASRRSVPTLARDTVRDGAARSGAARRLPVPPLAPGATASLGYELRPARRGVLRVGPAALEVTDPFGLLVSRLATPGVAELVVAPAWSRLVEGGRLVSETEGDAAVLHRLAVGGDDDVTTREYRPGDALRRVHWRASARQGELMVRQEEPRTRPDVLVIADTRASSFPARDPSAFEWVLRMVASLGVHLGDTGHRVELVETGTRQLAAPDASGSRETRHEAFLTSLALAAPQPDAAPRPPDVAGPVFAVVASPDLDTARWIARRRSPGERGTVFLLETAGEGSARVFEDAGWRCVPTTASTDPADAWLTATRTVDRAAL